MLASQSRRRGTTCVLSGVTGTLMACAALVGCGSRTPDPTPTSSTSAPSPAVFDSQPGWTHGGVDGVPPAACLSRPGPDATTLPDPACTPGAIDLSVPSTISSSALPALAGLERNPPADVRSAAQLAVFTAYGIPVAEQSAYTLDPLVPVSLGGSWNYRNLWPVPTPELFAPNRTFRNQKDVVTVYLRDAVTRGLVPLGAVQDAVSSNWTTAVAVLRLPAVPDSFARGG